MIMVRIVKIIFSIQSTLIATGLFFQSLYIWFRRGSDEALRFMNAKNTSLKNQIQQQKSRRS